jgi:hypothetical protein
VIQLIPKIESGHGPQPTSSTETSTKVQGITRATKCS